MPAADAVKNRHRPGLDLTTRMVAGVGVPQFHRHPRGCEACPCGGACRRRRWRHQIFRRSRQGDRRGADCAMIGSLLAGTDEAPGEVMLFRVAPTNRTAAWARSRHGARFGRIATSGRGREHAEAGARGHRGPRALQGSGRATSSNQLVGGLRAAMGYTGNATIRDMQTNRQFLRHGLGAAREPRPRRRDHARSGRTTSAGCDQAPRGAWSSAQRRISS